MSDTSKLISFNGKLYYQIGFKTPIASDTKAYALMKDDNAQTVKFVEIEEGQTASYVGSNPINVQDHTIQLLIDDELMQITPGGELSVDLNEISAELVNKYDLLAMPKEETDGATGITITKTVPGTAYTYGTLTSLSITDVTKSTIECTIEFTAGTDFTIELPSTLQTVGDTTFRAGKKYILAIYNNIMAIGEMN